MNSPCLCRSERQLMPFYFNSHSATAAPPVASCPAVALLLLGLRPAAAQCFTLNAPHKNWSHCTTTIEKIHARVSLFTYATVHRWLLLLLHWLPCQSQCLCLPRPRVSLCVKSTQISTYKHMSTRVSNPRVALSRDVVEMMRLFLYIFLIWQTHRDRPRRDTRACHWPFR